MLTNSNLADISDVLLAWYLQHKRDLPWRKTTDPYQIWISEIILQQTRVAQGYHYFCRFVDQFPDIYSLANASEAEVLKCWQGLGYYSRARNLHQAARRIVERYGGIFPDQYVQILSLQGVGEYTAAAIASLAFGMPYAVVDGNVYRFLSRLFGIETPIDSTTGKRQFKQLADLLLDKKRSGLYNQAVMEFGALQCVPLSPCCEECPLADRCVALYEKKVTRLPVKNKITKVTDRYFYYFVVLHAGNVWLQKRTAKDVWQNLYEFPLLESDYQLDDSEIVASDFFRSLVGQDRVGILSKLPPVRHKLSHQTIIATSFVVELPAEREVDERYIAVNHLEMDEYPVSKLVEIIMKNLSENWDF
jgi:A/G-specific adenine glycosylase